MGIARPWCRLRVLADEPMSSPDPALSRSLMDLLRHINLEDRLTVITSLHVLIWLSATVAASSACAQADRPRWAACRHDFPVARRSLSDKRRMTQLALGGRASYGVFSWARVDRRLATAAHRGCAVHVDFTRRMLPRIRVPQAVS